jgi:uncharacterized membrane protein YidH (DUF202 family)
VDDRTTKRRTVDGVQRGCVRLALTRISELPAPRGRPAGETAPQNPHLLRDRLANERTSLAWLRTGIAVSGLGYVVARFDIFLQQIAERMALVAGAALTLHIINTWPE